MNEMTAQVNTLRDDRLGTVDIPGHVHFRMSSLSQDSGYLGEVLHQSVYTEPALVPAFPWLGGEAPATPTVTATTTLVSGTRRYTVMAGNQTPVAWWLVQRRLADGKWSAALYHAATPSSVIEIPDVTTAGVFAVRGIGRTGAEGAMTLVGW
jgi:hypothetical protein